MSYDHPRSSYINDDTEGPEADQLKKDIESDDDDTLWTLNQRKPGDEDQKYRVKAHREEPPYYRAIWGPFPRHSLVDPKHASRNPYTQLATDRFERWLCPGPHCTLLPPAPGDNKEQLDRWKYGHMLGYTFSDNSTTRDLIKSQNTEFYTRAHEDKDAAYFANPPDADKCLWTWTSTTDGTSKQIRCNFNRMAHCPKTPGRSKLGPEKYILDKWDPNNPVGRKHLKARMKRKNIHDRNPEFTDNHWDEKKDRGLIDDNRYADEMRSIQFAYSGTWPCPKCSIAVEVEELEKLAAWRDYARSLRTGSDYHTVFMSIIWYLNGVPNERYSFINNFANTQSPNPSYICANQNFGNGADSAIGEACGYQFGTEYRFVTEGK